MRPVSIRLRWKSVQLLGVTRQADDLHGPSGAAGFGDHVHGFAGDNDRIGQSQHPIIGIFPLPGPDHCRVAMQQLPQPCDVGGAGAPRSRDQQSDSLIARKRRELVGDLGDLPYPKPMGSAGAAEQHRHVGPRQIGKAGRPFAALRDKKLGGHAMQRARHCDDIVAIHFVMLGHDHAIEAAQRADRRLDLHRERAPLACLLDVERGNHAGASGADEQVRPRWPDVVTGKRESSPPGLVQNELAQKSGQAQLKYDRSEPHRFGQAHALVLGPGMAIGDHPAERRPTGLSSSMHCAHASF